MMWTPSGHPAAWPAAQQQAPAAPWESTFRPTVWSSFSDDAARDARASSSATVQAQEEQLAHGAQLAVAMLQRLAADGEPYSDSMREILVELESGTLSADEAIARLKSAIGESLEEEDGAEEGAPRGEAARRQKDELDSLPIRYRRALRPHVKPSTRQPNTSTAYHKFASKTERFADRISRQERQGFDLRGPAAYHPQWQAEASYTPVPPAVSLPTAARFQQPSAAAGGLGSATRSAAYCSLPSSMGPQGASTRRSMPLSCASAPTSAFAAPMNISGTGRPLNGRPPSVGRPQTRMSDGPGPGTYNA